MAESLGDEVEGLEELCRNLHLKEEEAKMIELDGELEGVS